MNRKHFLFIALASVACTPVRSAPEPSYAMEWPVVVQLASEAVDSGNYANAEKVLTGFAARYPRTREARETLFWRALYKLDPVNRSSTVSSGLALLDQYISDSTTILYRSEASVLKRLAVTAQLLQAKAGIPPARDTAVVKPATEAELVRLKEQLARTTAELERIKKRLAEPSR